MRDLILCVKDVVEVCSGKWSDKSKCYLCDCDSNWYTNMFLDYVNNYISLDTFVIEEILPMLDWEGEDEFRNLKLSAKYLLSAFMSVRHMQPSLSYERIGEICIKILKGEA